MKPSGARRKAAASPRPTGPPEAEGTPLWSCLQRQDYSGVEAILKGEGKPPVNARDAAFGWTPVLFAASAGNVQVLSLLLKLRASVEPTCEEGNTALSLAARGGHVKAIQLLVAKKADVQACNRHGWTPLLWSAIDGQLQATEALLEASADFNAVDQQLRTPCMWAARHGHQAVLEVFVKKSLDLQQRDADGLTAMDHAAEHLSLKAAIVLAEERNRRLLDAAQRNNYEALIAAVEEGACVETKDEQGWTPLMWAALHDSVELATVLVDYGADPMMLGEESELAEHIAQRHMAVSSSLGTVIQATQRLLAASAEGDWVDVAEALSLGAFVNTKDKEKRTSLMWAASNGSAWGVQMLLDARAPMEERDAWGWTALLYGVVSRSPEVVSLLWFARADFSVTNYDGDGAFHIAVRGDDAVMLQVLIATKMDAEVQDYSFRTPLQSAAARGAVAATRALIFLGASHEAADDHGRTALALAALNGQRETCEVFLCGDELNQQEVPEEIPFEVSDSEYIPTPSDSEASDASGTDEGSPKAKGSRRPSGLGQTMPAQGEGRRKSAGSRRPSGLGETMPALGKEAPRKPGSRRPSVSGADKAAPAEAPRKPSGARRPSAAGLAQTMPAGDAAAKAKDADGNLSKTVPAKAKAKSAANRRSSVPSPARPSKDGSVSPKGKGAGDRRMSAPTGPPKKRRGSNASNLSGLSDVEQQVQEPQNAEQLLYDAAKRRLRLSREHSRPEMLPRQALLGAVDEDGCPVLQLACRGRAPKPSLVRLLLDSSAAVDAQDATGRSALMEAALAASEEVVEELLEEMPKLTLVDQWEQTARDLAASEQVRLLVERAEAGRAVEGRRTSGDKPPGAAAAGEPEAEKPPIFRVRIEQLPTKLPGDIIVEDIRSLLRHLGARKHVYLEVVLDPITERPKGYAYVDFLDQEARDLALKGDGEEVCGCPIRTYADQPAAMVR